MFSTLLSRKSSYLLSSFIFLNFLAVKNELPATNSEPEGPFLSLCFFNMPIIMLLASLRFAASPSSIRSLANLLSPLPASAVLLSGLLNLYELLVP